MSTPARTSPPESINPLVVPPAPQKKSTAMNLGRRLTVFFFFMHCIYHQYFSGSQEILATLALPPWVGDPANYPVFMIRLRQPDSQAHATARASPAAASRCRRDEPGQREAHPAPACNTPPHSSLCAAPSAPPL